MQVRVAQERHASFLVPQRRDGPLIERLCRFAFDFVQQEAPLGFDTLSLSAAYRVRRLSAENVEVTRLVCTSDPAATLCHLNGQSVKLGPCELGVVLIVLISGCTVNILTPS